MFKWVCLAVAVVALAVFGWMLNDLRLKVEKLADRADKLTGKVEDVTDRVDKHLPKILAETEQVGKTVNTDLPPLVKRSETALAQAELAMDSLAELSSNFSQFRDLMGVVHAGSQNKPLFSYGTSILNFIGEQPKAVIGTKTPGPKPSLRHAVPAKEWASAAQKDAYFLSLAAKTKSDVLHGLARTRSAAPLFIQLGDQLPRLLGDWLQESHPDSKALK
jgi:hypothetical protein